MAIKPLQNFFEYSTYSLPYPTILTLTTESLNFALSQSLATVLLLPQAIKLAHLLHVSVVALTDKLPLTAMKFGKHLRGIVECSFPEWQPNFMSYKELKKRIIPREGCVSSESTRADENDTDIPSASAPAAAAETAPLNGTAPPTIDDSAGFFTFLKAEVEKVNDFFLEKQEDFIIEHQQLTSRVQELLVAGAATRANVNRLRQRLIDFHAQLVILENYSTVNYTGFRKILKKHDKKTGLNVRSSCLRNLSATPFFLSDIARRLLLTTERQIAELDTICKFRRPDTNIDLPPPPTLYALPNPALGLMTLAPLEASQAAVTSEGAVSLDTSAAGTSSAVVVTAPSVDGPSAEYAHDDANPSGHPEPCAHVGARCRLLRLFRDAVEFSRLFTESSGTTPPPQSLVDEIDGLDACTLGLSDEFVQKVTRPYDYCFAADEAFAVGFFVITKGATLQLFNFERPGAVVSRLVRGKAQLRVFGALDGEDKGGGKRLVELRTADVVGPWPAVTACTNTSYVEWTPRETCAIAYIQCPPVGEGRLKRYALVQDDGAPAGEVRATQATEDEALVATRVWF